MKAKAKKLVSSKKLNQSKTIVLTSQQVRVTQNLGDGFRRLILSPVQIGPNTTIALDLRAPSGRVVISGGWTISALLPAWPTDSFPISDNRWIIFIQNPTNFTRSITPYLITKRR
ncbi:hypothetical protein ACHHV8_16870 [Paenibacillus sp. TAB 01]|uniref:hypothetical protein n=1 Tax=Paenibacillus sp. TAB 01 TaxID=3368988 RepID=UPI003753D60F